MVELSREDLNELMRKLNGARGGLSSFNMVRAVHRLDDAQAIVNEWQEECDD